VIRIVSLSWNVERVVILFVRRNIVIILLALIEIEVAKVKSAVVQFVGSYQGFESGTLY
jgi:hypothetical protein